MFILTGTVLALLLPQTDSEAEAFAHAFVKDVREGNAAAVDARCDQEAVLAIALQGIDPELPQVKGFRQGVKKSAGFGFGPLLKGIMENGGSYTLLRTRRVKGSFRALCRLIHPDGSLNYHDLVVAGKPPRVADIDLMAIGDTISGTYRQALLKALAAEPSRLGRLLGKENEYAKALPQLIRLSNLKREGKNAEVWAAFDALPEILKKDKDALFLRYQAALELGDKEMTRAFEDFRAAFPAEVCVDFFSIDAHFTAQRFAEALKAIDRVDALVGGDAYLQVLGANIHTAAGEHPQAVERCRRALAAEKTLAPAYETLLGLSLSMKDFKTTAETLTAYERDGGAELNDVTGLEAYQEFVKSEAGRAWLKARARD